MNTTLKGNEFEERSYEIIQKALKKGDLGFIESQCKVFRKKGYYSNLRKSDIIFDLAIEIWPPNAERYALLCLIECKCYKDPIPVGDVEEFYTKVSQVSGTNVKAILITNNDLQIGGANIVESLGMMHILLNYDDSYQILLHKIHRSTNNQFKNKTYSWEDTIESILTDAFNKETRVTGIQKLSKKNISEITKNIINDFNPNILKYITSIPFDEFIKYIEKKYRIGIDCSKNLSNDSRGNSILGYYSQKEQKIYIEKNIVGSIRFHFVLCHELGHFFLHQNLKFNQKQFDLLPDSEFSFKHDKHLFENDKHWIEWQANFFAASLIAPETCLLGRVIVYQLEKGIRNRGTIYVDNQPDNKKEFYTIVTFLSNYFLTSRTTIINRLEELDIIIYDKKQPLHWTRFSYLD